MLLGFVLGTVVWAQPAEPVGFQPLVDFGSFIEDITQFFTDTLKDGWVLFLTLFFVGYAVYYAIKMVDDKEENLSEGVDTQKELPESQVLVSRQTAESRQAVVELETDDFNGECREKESSW